ELVIRGGRSPIAGTSFALLPEAPGAQQLWPLIRSRMASDANVKHSHQPHRIIMIHERYRFPLSGIPLLVGDEATSMSLRDASCTDFPTFRSRTDIGWTGVSDDEIASTRRAEAALAVALLLEVAHVAEGH